MSAYVSCEEHIAALVGAALERELSWARQGPKSGTMTELRRLVTDEAADGIGRMLHTANLRSVAHLYGRERDDEQLPGRGEDPPAGRWNAAACRDAVAGTHPLVLLNAVEGYSYQACHIPAWPRSEAFAFCSTLRGAIIAELTKDVPGRDIGPRNAEAVRRWRPSELTGRPTAPAHVRRRSA